ncbi:MAG: hypothetical protein AAB278_05510 [Pseudomonadota bacterium]
MKNALLTVCCALWIAAFNTAFADSQDEFTQAVVGYEVTLPRVEAYESALADLVQWVQSHPNDEKLFRDKNVRITSLDEAAKRLESVPGIKSILDKHQITGRDMSLMPMALLSSRAVVMAEKRGTTMPPGQTNTASVALVRANDAQVDKLLERIMSHLRALRGSEKENHVNP